MGVFGTHYDMNTFSLAECSFYPWFLCLQKERQETFSQFKTLQDEQEEMTGELVLDWLWFFKFEPLKYIHADELTWKVVQVQKSSPKTTISCSNLVKDQKIFQMLRTQFHFLFYYSAQIRWGEGLWKEKMDVWCIEAVNYVRICFLKYLHAQPVESTECVHIYTPKSGYLWGNAVSESEYVQLCRVAVASAASMNDWTTEWSRLSCFQHDQNDFKEPQRGAYTTKNGDKYKHVISSEKMNVQVFYFGL